MFCISHYYCLHRVNVKGEQSKQSVCRACPCVNRKQSALVSNGICENFTQNAAGGQIHSDIYDHCV